MRPSALRAKSLTKAVAQSCAETQWAHYLGMCGKWHGEWRRYKPNQAGGLDKVASFRVQCAAETAGDRLSVRHANIYEAGYEPSGVKGQPSEDGAHVTVVFGSFTKTNFMHPFGKHSIASYLSSAAVVSTSSLYSQSFFVELLLMQAVRDGNMEGRRQRLVAAWTAEESPQRALFLQSVTAISEYRSVEDLENFTDFGRPVVDELGGLQLPFGMRAYLPQRIDEVDIAEGLEVTLASTWSHKDVQEPCQRVTAQYGADGTFAVMARRVEAPRRCRAVHFTVSTSASGYFAPQTLGLHGGSLFWC
eukprot:1972424-Amphidinium_carterae.1